MLHDRNDLLLPGIQESMRCFEPGSPFGPLPHLRGGEGNECLPKPTPAKTRWNLQSFAGLEGSNLKQWQISGESKGQKAQ